MEKDMTGKESIQMEQKKTDVFRGNESSRRTTAFGCKF